jgi:hypothetical protein
MMVRLALAKYMKSTAVTDSPAEAFMHFTITNLDRVPFEMKVTTNRFRETRCYIRVTNGVFSANKAHLGAVFRRYCNNVHGSGKTMNMDEYILLLTEQNISQHMTDLEVRACFIDSKLTVANEDISRARQLNWYDFMEAITRIADLRDWSADDFSAVKAGAVQDQSAPAQNCMHSISRKIGARLTLIEQLKLKFKLTLLVKELLKGQKKFVAQLKRRESSEPLAKDKFKKVKTIKKRMRKPKKKRHVKKRTKKNSNKKGEI